MPTASLRSVTASLGFHAMLLAAAHDAATGPRRVPHALTAHLESTIAIEALGMPGEHLPSPVAPGVVPRGDAHSVTSRNVPSNVPRALPKRAPSPPASTEARVPSPTAPAPAPLAAPVPARPPVPVPPAGADEALVNQRTAARGEVATMSASRDGSPATDLTQPIVPGPGSGIGRNAPARDSGPARASLLVSYLEAARERVARHREYPYVARRANLEGTVCLRVVIAASGRVLGVTPTCGTTHRPLLEAALASVAKAAPFPALPAALGSRLTFDVPVVFELEHL